MKYDKWFYIKGMVIGVLGIHLLWLCFFPLAWFLGRVEYFLSLYNSMLLICIVIIIISLISFGLERFANHKESEQDTPSIV